MNEDNEKYLLKTYPTLYYQHSWSMSQTCMCWGFCVGDGWFPLLDLLSKAILPLVEKFNKRMIEEFEVLDDEDKALRVEPERFGVVQVKQKFAGLRYYTNWSDPEIDKIINIFEGISYQTCEVCGKWGVPRKGGWIETLCDEHANGKEKAGDF